MKYELSKDYKKAFELAKKKRLVCWVDYSHDGETVRDIATTGIPENTLIVSARGIMYAWIPNVNFNLFRQACVENKIEFFLPIKEEAIAHHD